MFGATHWNSLKSSISASPRNGIFNSNGFLAAHSRTLLRASFAKDNLSFYEMHTTNLLPTDGQEVDLQQLFFQITMD